MATYVSKDGLDKLKEELSNRKEILRKEITERISCAKELGDLSENFEYHEAKESQGLNESRIVELEQMLKDIIVVEQQSGGNTIGLGTHFDAVIDGQERCFEIVGSNEADPLAGRISNESPIGRSFMGRAAGESVEVQTPAGTKNYLVKKIY